MCSLGKRIPWQQSSCGQLITPKSWGWSLYGLFTQELDPMILVGSQNIPWFCENSHSSRSHGFHSMFHSFSGLLYTGDQTRQLKHSLLKLKSVNLWEWFSLQIPLVLGLFTATFITRNPSTVMWALCQKRHVTKRCTIITSLGNLIGVPEMRPTVTHPSYLKQSFSQRWIQYLHVTSLSQLLPALLLISPIHLSDVGMKTCIFTWNHAHRG